MPDAGLTPGSAGWSHRVCVIGAGISGLVAAGVLRARGYDVAVVEKSGDLGGVWEPARSYPGVQTQTPRDLYCFSDFPMPAEYPEWPSGAQMHAYLVAYAQRFGLRPCIRFRTEVLSLARRTEAPGWLVTLRGAGAAVEPEPFDLVVVATGQFSRPRTLRLPGEDAFVAAGGRILHSSQHGDGAGVRGRDVAVVGFAKSATDIAMNAVAEGAHGFGDLSPGTLEDPLLLRRGGQLQVHSLLPRRGGDVHPVGAEPRRPPRAEARGPRDLGELAGA